MKLVFRKILGGGTGANMMFYHGSMVPGITELGTNSLTYGKTTTKAVYLTPNRAYALFYIKDIEINHVTCGVTDKGYIRYDEQFPDQLKKVYQEVDGYLYHCNEREHFSFTKTRDIWVSEKPVEIERVEYISDVYTELLKYEEKGDIKIIKYNELTDEQKQLYYEMALQYIYKTNLIGCFSKKADFWKNNFPKAWEYAAKNPHKKQAVMDAWDERNKNG